MAATRWTLWAALLAVQTMMGVDLAVGQVRLGARPEQRKRPELPEVGQMVRKELEQIIEAPDGPWAKVGQRGRGNRFDPEPLAKKIRADEKLAAKLIPWLLDLSPGGWRDAMSERMMDTPALRAHAVLAGMPELVRPYAVAAMLDRDRFKRLGAEAAALLDRQGLIEVLEKGPDGVKASVLSRLRRYKPDELQAAAGPAVAALDSDEPHVQQAACELLAHIGRLRWRAAEKLEKLLASRHEQVAIAAAKALVAPGRRDLTPVLIRRLPVEERTEVRVALVLALGRQGDPLAGRALKPLLKDEKASIRAAAARALGQIRYLEAIEGLIKTAGGDADVPARAAAIEALGLLGDPAALEVLLAALEDKHLWVRRMSIRALGKLARPEAIDPLAAIVMDPEADGGLRREAVEAMARIPSQRVIWRLIDAMEQEGYIVDVFHALRELTGHDYRGNVERWVSYRRGMQALLREAEAKLP